ncbi:leucine-rich repeat domain-containing protein [Flavobacterium sp. UGB4466]|uniref:leucine-rich repeat domain-containing protein n=1 Tax=Flavobacterium sp. UGB4466 TaxID=2730889 RepID=UPI00192B5C0D|nr:T9SS type A sorting domain-containing protein [Flavobacterium sp. UGB4466]
MKTKLLLLLLLANLSINAQTNLVPNGDLENWSSSSQPDNWYRYFSGFISQSTIAQKGSSSTNMKISSGTFNYINSEFFPVTASKTYRITMYHKLVSGTFSKLDFSVYHKPGAFKAEIIKKTDAVFSSSEWRKIEFEYTPTVSENIEIDIWTTGTQNSEILVDNVSVVDIADVPSPYTLIPDVNFENKLIALGIDSGTADGKVLTSKVSTITEIDLYNSNITDLTGIQDFINLKTLDCGGNKLLALDVTNNTQLTTLRCNGGSGSSTTRGDGQLTNLNVSKNTLLTFLDCGNNQITNLNISQNTLLKTLICNINRLSSLDTSNNMLLTLVDCGANDINTLDFSNSESLQILRCSVNKLTTMNISNNRKLIELDCISNLLTSLDISKNPDLTRVRCGSNKKLSSLNLKNGTNKLLKLTLANIMFWDNPNLKCIEVDDVAYSEANWSDVKDATATYSNSCKTLGIDTNNFAKATIYPNPTKGEVNIQNASLEKATVYNSLGQLVKTFVLNSDDTNNVINLYGLPKGVYYIYLINKDAASAKKIIVE